MTNSTKRCRNHTPRATGLPARVYSGGNVRLHYAGDAGVLHGWQTHRIHGIGRSCSNSAVRLSAAGSCCGGSVAGRGYNDTLVGV